MSQSNTKSLSMFDGLEQIKTILEAIELAEQSGHGEMLDAYWGDIRAILADVEGGVDRCIGFIKYAEKSVEAIDEEISRLKALKSRREDDVERIKSVALSYMEHLKVKSLDGGFNRKFVLASSASCQIVSLDQVPDNLKRVTTSIEPNKKDILERLKNGDSVPGAVIVYKKHVRVL